MNICKKMVVTDVDGTLFNDRKKVSQTDLCTLNYLHNNGVCTALATGRSIWSFNNMAGADFPVDYLIFSCGAGIMDWKKKKVIYDTGIEEEGISQIKEFLFSLNADFCVHQRIPDNHFFFPYRTGKDNPDFQRRINAYISFVKKVDDITRATQFLAIFNTSDHKSLIEKADSALMNFNVIRSTSPMDKKSLWMEIYQKGVSKSSGINFIAKMLDIPKENIMTIGNDYNDKDMLDWTKCSFITKNGPEELKKKYINVESNNNSGFSEGVNIWLKKYC